MKRIVTISLSKRLVEEIERNWKEEIKKNIENNSRIISKSEYYEKVIKLGLRALKDGWFL